jgi:hypothetical protein
MKRKTMEYHHQIREVVTTTIRASDHPEMKLMTRLNKTVTTTMEVLTRSDSDGEDTKVQVVSPFKIMVKMLFRHDGIMLWR